MFGIILKTTTTVLIAIMMLLILFFAKGVEQKASKVGFGIMELVYTLSIVCIWM